VRSAVGSAAALSVVLSLFSPSPAAAQPHSLLSLTTAVSLSVQLTPDVDSLEGRADRLRAELDEIEARAAWTQERLAHARDQLAVATSSAITVDEQLDALNGASTDAQIDIAHRVRAIEQSGGAAALYSQALDATALTDVTSNVASLNAVLSTDVVRAADAATASRQMAEMHSRLDTISDQRARLVSRIRVLADDARALLKQQRALVSQADARVQRALEAIEQREAASVTTTWSGPLPTGPTPYASEAVAAALSKLGSPYVWGDEGPSTFDCSGLIQWAYLQAGLVLPRVSRDQYGAGALMPTSQMQPGDVLSYAYDTSDPGTIYHVTMYIGDGLMVHAPRTGDVVKVVPVDYDSLIGVTRPGV
jgi:peptidoglycan DL-endopeptidase CwlO